MSLLPHFITKIFSSNPITLAEIQLNEARISSLESVKKALYHKAESECNRIYSEMYAKHALHLVAQLEEWNQKS